MGSVIGNLTGGLIGESDAEKEAKRAKKRQEEERRRLEEEKKRALEEEKRMTAETADKAKVERSKNKDRFGGGNTAISELSVIDTPSSKSVLGSKDEEEEKLGGV